MALSAVSAATVQREEIDQETISALLDAVSCNWIAQFLMLMIVGSPESLQRSNGIFHCEWFLGGSEVDSRHLLDDTDARRMLRESGTHVR